MKKKTATIAQTDFYLDLTLHKMPASVLTEFTEKIVNLYYGGNLNAAMQELMYEALADHDFVLSHITHVKAPTIA